VRLEAVPRTEDSLTSCKERGPGRELTLSFGSSFFCNQVFFVYDPSSSTSLLSSVSSDQGKCEREVMVKVMVDLRGPLQELALGRLTLTACPPMAGETDHRWPRLATPAHKCCCCRSAALQGCCCNCAAELCKAAGPALRGSSQAPPPSSCDLLQPGLL